MLRWVATVPELSQNADRDSISASRFLCMSWSHCFNASGRRPALPYCIVRQPGDRLYVFIQELFIAASAEDMGAVAVELHMNRIFDDADGEIAHIEILDVAQQRNLRNRF